MAAMPEALARKHSGAFSAVMPPIAITGISTAAQMRASRSTPCGGP